MHNLIQTGDFLRFLVRQRSVAVLVGMAFIVVISAGAAGLLLLDPVLQVWSRDWDPMLGIATLIVAIFVWISEARQDWLNALPSRLTATFTHEGRTIMRCERAHLASEADIRMLAQQLGKQMNEGKELRLIAPAIRASGGDAERDEDGELYRHWHVTVPLAERPGVIGQDSEGRVLLWQAPFNKCRWTSQQP